MAFDLLGQPTETIMKTIILAGGRGTRLGVQTQIHNKHLLPVYSQQGAYPMICYPLQTLIRSGSRDTLIVSSQEHSGDIIEFLGDGAKFGTSLTYRIQDHNDPARPVGIASAMKLIKGFTHNEPFAVILGDNFYEDSFGVEFAAFEETYRATGLSGAHIFLKEVDDVHRFGCAKFDAAGKLIDIIEKPKDPPSNFAVSGLYLFTPDVFDILETLVPSKRGELEVSEVNASYVKKGNMTYTSIPGFWHDLGTPESMHDGAAWIQEHNFKVTIYDNTL
jgi:glucose-1-phosphate thymidylyltransferase